MISDAVFLYQFQVRGRYPALAPVGKFDIPPAADLVKDEDTRAFVQDEQVLGRLRTGGTLDGRHRNSDDGSVRTVSCPFDHTGYEYEVRACAAAIMSGE